MKRIRLILAAVVLCLVMGCGSSSNAEELVIGMLQDLSGATGLQGIGQQRGVQMKVEEINNAGGINGTTIRLVEYDIKADVTESINAYRRMIELDKVSIVIGPSISNIGIALAPLSEVYKIPVVGAFLDDRTVQKEDGSAYKYMFMAQPSASQQAEVIVKYAINELGAKNFAVLYNAGNAYCVSLYMPFVKFVEEIGGNVVAIETFQDADRDYRTQLTKIKDAQPDALYIPNYPAQVPLCVQQAREIGFEGALLGANNMLPTIFLAGDLGYNTTYFPYNIIFDNEDIQEFDKEFQERWEFETNAQVFIATDALSIIVAAYEKAGSTNPEALTEAIEGITVNGWMGAFTISEETHKPIGLPMGILNIIDDGQPNTLAIISTTSR